jgi:hypothetical protein
MRQRIRKINSALIKAPVKLTFASCARAWAVPGRGHLDWNVDRDSPTPTVLHYPYSLVEVSFGEP